MISICRKPIFSAYSRFFQDDDLQLNTDLFAVMRIWDHDEDAVLHHMKMLFAGIRACKPEPRQSFDQFPPCDRHKFSRQPRLAPLRILWCVQQ